MEIVTKMCAAVLELGNKLGAFLIPALVVLSLALLFFARHSFKLFKIALPLAGLAAGYLVGSKELGPVLAKSVPELGSNAGLIAGIACAVLIGIFCLRARTFTVLVIGICVGYALVGDVVIKAMREVKFIAEIVLNTDMSTAIILAAIISLICAIITMLIFKKFFNIIYLFATSVAGAALALAVPVIFICAKMAELEVAVVAAAGVGALIGLIFFAKQYSYHKYYW